ncbi:unnamed protein product [Blepharisma stoltei]|uniref:Uncharacterized protein n=1 Tax=Blepharisma stoltei TaxID=1481888 RepID=A0AAU9IUS7_9CILI|nr:unnamed protein product [Blepharisma stoltei]
MNRAEKNYQAQFASLKVKQPPGGSSSFAFGWSNENNASAKPTGKENSIIHVEETKKGGETPAGVLPPSMGRETRNTDIISNNPIIKEEKKNLDETNQRKKAEEEILRRFRVGEERKAEERKKTTKTSVKVKNPPGGKSYVPFG